MAAAAGANDNEIPVEGEDEEDLLPRRRYVVW